MDCFVLELGSSVSEPEVTITVWIVAVVTILFYIDFERINLYVVAIICYLSETATSEALCWHESVNWTCRCSVFVSTLSISESAVRLPNKP